MQTLKFWPPFMVLVLLTAATIISCEQRPPTEPQLLEAQQDWRQMGSICVTKSAEGHWKRCVIYEWTSSTQTTTPDSIVVPGGDCGAITQVFALSREIAKDSSGYGVGGRVGVYNGTDLPTENLEIVDIVRYKIGDGLWIVLAVDTLDISEMPVIAPGEYHYYPYKIVFDPIPEAIYKNVAYIRNGVSIIQTEYVPFTIPDVQDLTETDAEVYITADVSCPDGFTCTPSDPGPWTVTETDTINFSLDVCNVSADCESWYALHNLATLETMTTHRIYSDISTVAINAGPCPALSGEAIEIIHIE